MKKLYSFNVNKFKEVEDVTENEDGSKTTKSVVKEVPVEILIQKPSRILREQGNTFYKKKVSENVKQGIMTRAMFQKYIINGDGILAESEKKELGEKAARMTELEFKFSEIRQASSENKEKEEELQKLLLEYTELQKDFEVVEFSQRALFDNTAENDAQEKALLWWILFLCHIKEDEEYKPIFSGKTYEEKLESYDKLEESDDPFYNQAIEKATYFISLWMIGKAKDEEEFQAYDKEYQESSEPDSEEKENSNESTN